MKSVLISGFLIFSVASAFSQEKQLPAKPDPAKKILLVEASCGQCQFKMSGKGCSLAIRLDGKAYFVDGTDINSHGDAHANDGFCESIRKAEVQGELKADRFQVSWFKLLPTEKKGETKKEGL